MRRTRHEARLDKLQAVSWAEACGEVADSMAVRLAIIKRTDAGLITLAEAQAELKRIKRGATKAGMTTRGRVWRQG